MKDRIRTNKISSSVSYEDFIFLQQFNRKVSVGKYLMTGKALFASLSILILLYYFSDWKYTQYVSLLMFLFVVHSYRNTRLKYNSKLTMISRNGWHDEKNGGILVYSKLNWLRSIGKKR